MKKKYLRQRAFLFLARPNVTPGLWSRMRRSETEAEDSKEEVRGMREDLRRFVNIFNDLKKELVARREKVRKLREENEKQKREVPELTT